MQHQALIHRFKLQPHPEGGWYRETFRDVDLVDTARGPRPASTAILFLLGPGDRSHLHRIASAEVWHYHAGCGLRIPVLGPNEATILHLGLDVTAGAAPQHMVPAGRWFGAEPVDPTGWCLVGCTVAPGFDFADFTMATAADLSPEQHTRWSHLLPDG